MSLTFVSVVKRCKERVLEAQLRLSKRDIDQARGYINKALEFVTEKYAKALKDKLIEIGLDAKIADSIKIIRLKLTGADANLLGQGIDIEGAESNLADAISKLDNVIKFIEPHLNEVWYRSD